MLPSFTTFKHHHRFDTTSAHADVFFDIFVVQQQSFRCNFAYALSQIRKKTRNNRQQIRQNDIVCV